ncbi:MAG: hypothetical protein WC533_01795 [Candidatus Pacearchaeota archaeon]
MARVIRADLHNHLATHSPEFTLREVADIVRKKLGAGGMIAVVNFKTEQGNDENAWNYENLIKRNGLYAIKSTGDAVYDSNRDVTIVKAQEIPVDRGDHSFAHLLAIGISKGDSVKPWQSVEDTLADIKENYHAIVVVPHPFASNGLGDYLDEHPDLLGYIDAIETHSSGAALFFGANLKARVLHDSVKRDFPIASIKSSDGHSLSEIGRSYIEIPEPEIEEGLGLTDELSKNLMDQIGCGKSGNSYWPTIKHLATLAPIEVKELLTGKYDQTFTKEFVDKLRGKKK